MQSVTGDKNKNIKIKMMTQFSSSFLMTVLLSVGTWMILLNYQGLCIFGFGFAWTSCDVTRNKLKNKHSRAHIISKANRLEESSSRRSAKIGDMVGSKSYVIKHRILDLLDGTPPNEPTPQPLTLQLLEQIRSLEEESSNVATVMDPEEFLASLAGNWELIWTAQDINSPEYRTTNPLRRWINPLENQSYSNNPSGRKNPVLPMKMQDQLEQIGVLSSPASSSRESFQQPAITSTQSIDVKKQRVRNVVRFVTNIPLGSSVLQGTVTVDITFVPSTSDFRRIDVKFQKCRFTLSKVPLDISIPLGIIGPTGWLRTTYIDQDIRITRGHKGSVFLLFRTSQK